MNIRMKKNLVFVCSNQCQHNCVYCLTKEPWRDKLFEKVTITDTNLILKYIKIFGKYTNEMILTGFEPTLNKDFFKIISFAANNGIDYISVHTNGVLLGRRFIEKMKVYKEYLKIFISFPSANEKLYNGITQSKDFKKVFNALKLLQKNDFLFFVEIVICSLNIKDIENTIKKLDELGIKRIIFIHVITYKKRYNIKYSDSLPILEKVFKKFPDIKFQIYEVPPCILKKYPTLKKIRLNKCATNNELNIGEKICISKEQYKPVSCRRVLNICKGCDYLNNNQCSGAGRVYLDLYGDSEFKKFTRH